MNSIKLVLSIIGLLILPLLWSGGRPLPQWQEQPTARSVQDEKAARRKAAFGSARNLLAQQKVPFDPDELLKSNWKRNLKPVLDQMPELQQARQGTNKLKGAQLAHTLYLPENIQLTGDTVILARRVVFLGRDVVIKGPHDIFIFTVEGTELVENTASNRRARAQLLKTSLTNNHHAASDTKDGGVITLDLSGLGQKEWLANKALAAAAAMRSGRKNSHHVMFQNYSGSAGSNGGNGNSGSAGSNGSIGSDGADGNCSTNVNGSNGANGGAGGAGNAGSAGGNGQAGGDGGDAYIQPAPNQSVNVTSNGGAGGNGGNGGLGGTGGYGAAGGNGGNGVACTPCNGGLAANGGAGGRGGDGGTGGNGGAGGNGGDGGDGGDITVAYPPNYTGSINVTSNGGAGGSGGGGNLSGVGGTYGVGGNGGSGNGGYSCSTSGSTGQNGNSGNLGSNGTSGADGSAGAAGDDGYVDIYELSGEGCTPETCPGQCFGGVCTPTPIVVDVLGNGFDLTNSANGVAFDLNADGIRELTSWTSAASDDAWLALDRNNDGTINDGTELFGDYTPQPAAPAGELKNGFLALAEYDKALYGGNGDGVITASDSCFNSLRLWRDTNHNGVSEPSELHTLSELGLVTIELKHKESKRVDQYGNQFMYRAKVKDAHGSKIERWAWDVILVRNPE